jgi:chromosome segregation ATPase
MISVVSVILFLSVLSVVFYHWGQREMNKALSRLNEIQREAQIAMACKCQEKKTNKMDEPCADKNEESFRQAYNRMNKDYIQAKAQVAELEKRLRVTEEKASQYLESLSQKIHALEEYSSKAVSAMDPYARNKFIANFGNPPVTPSVA